MEMHILMLFLHLVRYVSFMGKSFDSAQATPAWLNCQPTKADLDEAKDVHEQLCSMIERYWLLIGFVTLGKTKQNTSAKQNVIRSPNYQYLPKVISVFVEVLCAGEVLATEETAKHMINLLRHFQHTLPPATWASAKSLLLPQQEMELESVLSPEEDVNILIDAMKLLVL
ncbi:hypothetical protein RND71_007038 [Anisodus tanguticus]|uniref:Uncharacterized protein n=1 Tax=Anisodus tanguticus TaxID=243964 RepID=A0AAE1SJ26_9SOLA|nr:hypothetical protein RND71_007038 [Anisodus tanguticus]